MTYRLSRRMVLGSAVAASAVTALPIGAGAEQGGISRKEIEVEGEGGKFDAYLAAPESGSGPGVIMISTIFGVDQGLKSYCDELAGRGCVVLAQNFFWRDPEDKGVLPVPAAAPRAIARAMRIDFQKSMDDLGRGVAELKRHPSYNGKMAVLGFCFGGPYAWRAACDGLGVDAAVSFHGTFVSKSMQPGDKPSCPVSFHYGDDDELAPQEELAAVGEVAHATGSEFIVYPGAKHAFMVKADAAHYGAGAATQAWGRTLQMIGALYT